MPQILTPDRTPQGWGNVASAYDEHIAKFTRAFAAHALDATGVGPGQRVLDVAAGTGALSLLAAQRGAQVLATDFAPPMIERLQANAAAQGIALDARVMDGQALELPDASFDAAFSIFGLMFFPDADRGMAQMHRVLRPGGRVGIVTWAPPERSETFSAFVGAMQEAVPDLPPPPQPPAVFSLADRDDLARRLQRAGFHDIAVQPVVKELEEGSPQAMWTGMTTSNPVMPGMLERVGPQNASKVQALFLRRMEDHMRGDRLVLRVEGNLATAVA